MRAQPFQHSIVLPLTPDCMNETTSSTSLAKGLQFSHFSSVGGRGTKPIKTHTCPMSDFITPLSPKVRSSPHRIVEHICLSQKGGIIIIPCSHRVMGCRTERHLAATRSDFPMSTPQYDMLDSAFHPASLVSKFHCLLQPSWAETNTPYVSVGFLS